MDDKRLKKIGHDLEKVYKKSKEYGLNRHVELSAVDIAVLSLLNELYKSKQLNYLVIGKKNFPEFGLLTRLCDKLLRAICPIVGFDCDLSRKYFRS